MEIIQIYCGVKYVDKDTAKRYGARWNMKEKKWYFEFKLNEFLNDETKHTGQFKPYKINYIQCDDYFKNSPIAKHKLHELIFQTAQNRNKQFIENHSSIDITEKPTIVLKQN